MSEAERQAQAAGEFDEAAAMRRAQPGSRPAGELEAMIAGIDQAVEVQGKHTLMIRMQRDWPTIRAALTERRELREALAEVVDASKHLPRSVAVPAGQRPYDLTSASFDRAIERAKALLARSAAGEEGRGE